MLLKKTLLAVAVATTFISGSAMADSWSVTQNAILGDDTTIKQTKGAADTTGALQGVNVINTSVGATTMDGSQTLSVSSGKQLKQVTM